MSRRAERWLSCPADKLGQQFQRVESEQQERIMYLTMDIEKIKKLPWQQPFRFDLGLAPSPEPPFNVPFVLMPEFDSEPDREPDSTGGFSVPKEYLQMVTRNWKRIHESKIHTVFSTILKAEDGSEEYKVKRLKSYRVNSRINKGLFELINTYGFMDTLDSVTCHFGIDNNKDYWNGEYRFTPVLQFHHKAKGDNLSKLIELLRSLNTIFSVNEDGEGLDLLEYIHPCPTDCPDEESAD